MSQARGHLGGETKQDTSEVKPGLDLEDTSEVKISSKLKLHKFKILTGILGIFVFIGAVFGAYKLGQRQIRPASESTSTPTIIPSLTSIPDSTAGWEGKDCVDGNTGERMTLLEAKEIALKSECVKEGNLKNESFCNQDTGTWWLDLDITKESCAPACVINVTTKKAEINWRCTGLLPE